MHGHCVYITQTTFIISGNRQMMNKTKYKYTGTNTKTALI